MSLADTIDTLVRGYKPSPGCLPSLSRPIPVARYGAGSVRRDSLRVLTEAGDQPATGAAVVNAVCDCFLRNNSWPREIFRPRNRR
jgi:hypothetical protein